MKINDQQIIELYEKSGDSPLGFMHICFETSDIESLRDSYLKVGVSPTEVKKFRAGNLLFTMHDPSGQLLEYTQYLPGSLHSLDREKHLGKDRFSRRLVGSSTPATENEYYASKLGFRPTDTAAKRLRLPGDSGQWIDLLSGAGARPRIAFLVTRLERAENNLRQSRMKFEKLGKSIYVTDPDGTVVIFSTAGA